MDTSTIQVSLVAVWYSAIFLVVLSQSPKWELLEQISIAITVGLPFLVALTAILMHYFGIG
jgi:hypothetical protein